MCSDGGGGVGGGWGSSNGFFGLYSVTINGSGSGNSTSVEIKITACNSGLYDVYSLVV